ncbi:Rnf-Nqr domain containing protein [Pseudomonas sp. RGM2987]|uniref:Rnf-Nqr domain containing protein n=1 Tax=Pseudomonas sp. RGM2987 TaxID=2930090 RepID=UPI001FD6EABA|nr:Rnf-Nqr domain containing protein [Pseudomonas sp. RGM2987]MCJ8204166.1 NADH:quinone oxidoreductase [Pseudomonas sp. RGM2987]
MNRVSWLTRGLLLVALIGASDSLAGALGLWLAWAMVILGYGLTMSLLRPRLTTDQRLLASLVLVATLSTCTSFAVQAWALELYRSLNIYIGWIALSCVALEQQGFFVESRWPAQLRLAGLFGLSMLSLGALRELLGNGLPLALLAPGGFILLGLLLAAWQAWTAARPHSTTEETPRP